MIRRIPYLSEQVIERASEGLLYDFYRSRSAAIEWPVPLEDIVEKHLKLRIEFDDLHRRFDLTRPEETEQSDLLGAIFFHEQLIVMDESLDPEEHPAMEGRYRFTLAHEAAGHWLLHRHLFAGDPAQTSLFGAANASSVLCRSSAAKDPVEWQADFAASCALMPQPLVRAAWRKRFGNENARMLKERTRFPIPDGASPFYRSLLEGMERRKQEDLMRDFVKPLAADFQVSVTAMRIRLERLGLLLRPEPQQERLPVGT